MGWASAGVYFDQIAKALIDNRAPDDLKFQICHTMIGVFRDGDWDTEDESLNEFKDDPAIVRAFREYGIVIRCLAEGEVDGGWTECELEAGHKGDWHDDEHGHRWLRTVGDDA